MNRTAKIVISHAGSAPAFSSEGVDQAMPLDWDAVFRTFHYGPGGLRRRVAGPDMPAARARIRSLARTVSRLEVRYKRPASFWVESKWFMNETRKISAFA
jgi:hypothetical protein